MMAGATITGSALEHAGALIAAARAPAPERGRAARAAARRDRAGAHATGAARRAAERTRSASR